MTGTATAASLSILAGSCSHDSAHAAASIRAAALPAGYAVSRRRYVRVVAAATSAGRIHNARAGDVALTAHAADTAALRRRRRAGSVSAASASSVVIRIADSAGMSQPGDAGAADMSGARRGRVLVHRSAAARSAGTAVALAAAATSAGAKEERRIVQKHRRARSVFAWIARGRMRRDPASARSAAAHGDRIETSDKHPVDFNHAARSAAATAAVGLVRFGVGVCAAAATAAADHKHPSFRIAGQSEGAGRAVGSGECKDQVVGRGARIVHPVSPRCTCELDGAASRDSRLSIEVFGIRRARKGDENREYGLFHCKPPASVEHLP